MISKINLLLSATLAAFLVAGQAQALIIVDDTFDDGALDANVSGVGTGFVFGAQGGGASVTEAGGFAVLDSPLNGGRRVRISSNESADTSTTADVSFLFEDVNFAVSADNSGGADGTTRRQYVGVRNLAGAPDVGINPGEGFYVEFGVGDASGNPLGTSTFFYNDFDNIKTTLANWTFDTLLIDTGEEAGDPGSVTNAELDIDITLNGNDWSLDILGDTAGGSPISFSGTHAASSITNTVTTGHAFVHNQSESPNLVMSIGRVEIDFDIGVLGDFSGNGTIGPEDFTLLSNNLAGELDGPVDYFDGDIDFDGDVDLDDFGQFKAIPAGAAAIAAATNVPEPTTLALLAIAGGLLFTSTRLRR